MAPGQYKRFLFATLTASLVLLLAEVVSYVGIGVTLGHWFDLGPVGDLRGRLTGPRTDAAEENRTLPGIDHPIAIHPFVGYVLDPDLSEWELSDFGYYDFSPPLHERSAERVILGVFGGSYAHQLFEAVIDDVTRELAKDPMFHGKEFTSISTAIGGYKQPQQLMTLNYLLALGGEFDIVINIDGFNEVALHEAENRSHGVFPAYPRLWYYQTLGLSDSGFVTRAAEIVRIRDGRRARAELFSRWPWRATATANLVWAAWDKRMQADLVSAREELETYPRSVERYVATGPDFSQGDDATVFGEIADIWWRSSMQMSRLARANGIVYVHALQPNQYFEGSKPLSDNERAVAFDPRHRYRRGVVKGYPFLIEAADELRRSGVNFLDWTMAYENTEEAVYVDRCCHVNELGYELLVDDLVRAILDGYRDRARN